MTRLTFCIICLVSAVPAVFAQSKAAADDPRPRDGAVWYNARHGDPDAMNQVGVWCYTGNKVPRDYGQAFYWWSKAALQQNVKAIANLGVCYQYGRGVAPDSIEAMRLYITAIDGGQHELLEQRSANVNTNPFDAMLVGTCHEKGVGTNRSISRAADMYAAAARRGSVDGMRSAARMLLDMGNLPKAVEFLEMASDAGDLESLYRLGRLSIDGRLQSVPKSKGASYIKVAAEGGLPEAMAAMAEMYRSGNGVTADTAEATRWAGMAAEAGVAEAMWQYGLDLRRAGNFNDALGWLALAADAGYMQQFVEMLQRDTKRDPFVAYIYGMKSYLVDKDYNDASRRFHGIVRNPDAQAMEAAVLADRANPDCNGAKAAKQLEKLAGDNALATIILSGILSGGFPAPSPTVLDVLSTLH